jgi:hypothetical protein
LNSLLRFSLSPRQAAGILIDCPFGCAQDLLEVNHIPSITAFAEVREAYSEHVAAWLRG